MDLSLRLYLSTSPSSSPSLPPHSYFTEPPSQSSSCTNLFHIFFSVIFSQSFASSFYPLPLSSSLLSLSFFTTCFLPRSFLLFPCCVTCFHHCTQHFLTLHPFHPVFLHLKLPSPLSPDLFPLSFTSSSLHLFVFPTFLLCTFPCSSLLMFE